MLTAMVWVCSCKSDQKAANVANAAQGSTGESPYQNGNVSQQQPKITPQHLDVPPYTIPKGLCRLQGKVLSALPQKNDQIDTYAFQVEKVIGTGGVYTGYMPAIGETMHLIVSTGQPVLKAGEIVTADVNTQPAANNEKTPHEATVTKFVNPEKK